MFPPDSGHDLRSFGFAIDVSHNIDPMTRLCSGKVGLEVFEKNFGHLLSQQRGNGIPNLPSNFDLSSQEDEAIRERLQAGGFSMSNRSVLKGMKISTLFGLEELGPYGKRRPIPPQTPE